MISLRFGPSSDDFNTIGPLQTQVAEPNYTDWQNVDWTTLSYGTQFPGAFGGPAAGVESSSGLAPNANQVRSELVTEEVPFIPWSLSASYIARAQAS